MIIGRRQLFGWAAFGARVCKFCLADEEMWPRRRAHKWAACLRWPASSVGPQLWPNQAHSFCRLKRAESFLLSERLRVVSLRAAAKISRFSKLFHSFSLFLAFCLETSASLGMQQKEKICICIFGTIFPLLPAFCSAHLRPISWPLGALRLPQNLAN